MDDTFTLYDLKVEVVATDRPNGMQSQSGRLLFGTGREPGIPQRHFFLYVFFKCPAPASARKAETPGS